MSLANRKVDEMPTFCKGFLILLVLYHIPTCIATLRQQPQRRQDPLAQLDVIGVHDYIWL